MHLTTVLALVGRLVQDRVAQALTELGVSYAEASALMRLWYAGGHMPQSDMIQSLSLSRTACTLLLNQLERKGLVERRNDRRDGRRLMVWLTPAGQDLEQPVLEAIEQVESVIRAPLPARDVEDSFRMLRAVLQAVQTGRNA
ncbi:MAG TPA: MarR family transcriptional regulator [Candidatus Dormibacteraeota bacterium]